MSQINKEEGPKMKAAIFLAGNMMLAIYDSELTTR